MRCPLKSASFSVSPATQKVAKESEFQFTVTQEVDGAATNAQAKVSFKRDLIEIVKVEPGKGWKADSSALARLSPTQTTAAKLQVTLAADKTSPPPTSGQSTLVTVTARGRAARKVSPTSSS